MNATDALTAALAEAAQEPHLTAAGVLEALAAHGYVITPAADAAPDLDVVELALTAAGYSKFLLIAADPPRHLGRCTQGLTDCGDAAHFEVTTNATSAGGVDYATTDQMCPAHTRTTAARLLA